MKYLCLAYYDHVKFGAMPDADVKALEAKCRTHDEALRASGNLRLTASLGPPQDSVSIRPRGGKPNVTDGPYAEAKEIVGAFFVIEAKDRDEAVRVASHHPTAHLGEDVGWGVEIRPIDFFEER